MFSQSEYQAIQKEFNQHQNKRRKKTVKNLGYSISNNNIDSYCSIVDFLRVI